MDNNVVPLRPSTQAIAMPILLDAETYHRLCRRAERNSMRPEQLAESVLTNILKIVEEAER